MFSDDKVIQDSAVLHRKVRWMIFSMPLWLLYKCSKKTPRKGNLTEEKVKLTLAK